MRKTILGGIIAATALLLAERNAVAQIYSNTVMSLNPVGYWPLNETAQPPQPLNLTAVNFGSAGAAGNGYYGAWYQPSGNTWYITNNIVQGPAVTAPFDSSKGMVCSGGPGQYVIVPRNTNGVNNAAVTLNPPFSIEAWLKIGTTVSALGDIISQGGTVNLSPAGPNTNNPFYGGLATNVWAGVELGQYQDYVFLMCQATNASGVKSSELDSSAFGTSKGFKVGQWVHVVATFDGTRETLWTNGVVAGSKNTPTDSAGLHYVVDPTTPLMIGGGSDVSAAYGQGFQGTIDDVAIYNSVLPQASIQAHYQTAFGTNATYGSTYTNAVLADNPVLYYRLNDPQSQVNAGYPSGTFPVANNYGSSGAAGNGVYQPGTTPGVSGPPFSGFGSTSKAVALNGWFGGVDVGGGSIPSSLNPIGTVPISVVSWFQTGPADAPGRFQEIVGHSDSSYRLSLGQNQAGGDIHFNPGPGPELQFTNIPPTVTVSNGFAFNDGNWHMIAGVSDGTNEFLYLDGVLAKTNGNAAGINIVGTTRDLVLGGDPQYTFASFASVNTIRTFDGQVAQVAVWTNALTQAQIQSLFGAAAVPVYFWQQPIASVTANAGQNVVVPVGARGSAPVTYQWYQNGAPVAGQTNTTLNYSPVTTGEAGAYYLVANNAGGSVTSSVVNITVFGPPTVVQQSATQMNIFAGSSPVLHVSALGATPIKYQWTLNSAPITGATNTSLTLTNLQLSGTYNCLMTNFVGNSALTPIVITVLVDPTAPYPAAVLSDKPVNYFRLNEADTGYPNDGVTSFDYVGGDNGSYSNTSLAQLSYSTATEPADTSAGFGLSTSVNSYMGNVVTNYVNFVTPSGSNAEFSVETWVNAATTPNTDAGIVTIGYGFGGEQFAIDNGANDSNPQLAHSLRFYVNSASGQNYGVSTSFALGNNPGWHQVAAVCDEAGGFIYLYVDGILQGRTAIPAGAGLKGATAPLAIGARLSTVSATAYDNQFYGYVSDVALYNYALSQNQVQSHYLASGIAPVITGLLPSSNWTTNQAANVVFTVSANGTAPLAYQWLDNTGTPIPWGTNATLIISNVQPSQAGTYTVNVTNLYGGPVSTNVNLTVTQVPQIVSDITPSSETVYATTPTTLSVTVSGTPPLSYQWYQNGSPIPNATNTTYSFGALVGTNTYYLSVTNVYSAGNPTLSSTATIVGMPATSLNTNNYTDSLKITFVGYNRSETLSDFPVLVQLGTNVSGFNYNHFASPSGGDLRFTDSGGTRVIPYEIDEWNLGGQSTVWVQVPALSGTNTSVYAYWGNPSASTPLPGTNVWIPQTWEGLPSYDIVYHLKEGAFPFADSTGQNPALTGTAPAQTAGIVGTGSQFNGTSSYLDAGTAALTDPFTLSTWVDAVPHNPVGNGIETLWANQQGGFGSAGFAEFINAYQTSNGDFRFASGLGGGTGTENGAGAGTVTFSQWHLLSVTVSQSNLLATFFVDGNQVGTTPIKNGFPIAGIDLNLGRFTNNSLYYQGTMDEARIHSGIESSNWIWASWMTVQQNASLASYSSVSSTVTNQPTPVAIKVQFSSGNIVLSGTGGLAGFTFYVVGATNLMVPLSQWIPVATNTFDVNGNFNLSLPVNTGKPTQFLRIKE